MTPRAETRTVMAESGQGNLVFIFDPPARIACTAAIARSCSLFFEEMRIRAAISLLIDREGIAHSVLRLPGNAATQMFSPSQAEWHVPGLPPLKYDVAATQRLLSECG